MDVTVLPELKAFADSIFVEDPVLVFTEGAVLLRPGAPTRQGETAENSPILHNLLVLPEGEGPAANVIRINRSLLVSSNYPSTIDLLDQNGYIVVPIKAAEIYKNDAGLSCRSLRWFSVK